jgi:prophage antirepressor-like protein
VTKVGGQPWFVGKDVTEILGYTNASKALLDHIDEEDKLNNESLSSLGQRGGWLINESGLYSLILSSKLPTAKKFKHWVTSEVLPSIRKNGMYATDELLDNPDLLISVATKLKEEREARKLAEQQIQELKPKAHYADVILQS